MDLSCIEDDDELKEATLCSTWDHYAVWATIKDEAGQVKNTTKNAAGLDGDSGMNKPRRSSKQR